ncbi:MAG: hypothetical protein CXR31_00285 [Geobacter sp.]|nr:MAG: hypothetical protein CXR31_00285 [Geobacter sp.]
MRFKTIFIKLLEFGKCRAAGFIRLPVFPENNRGQEWLCPQFQVQRFSQFLFQRKPPKAMVAS